MNTSYVQNSLKSMLQESRFIQRIAFLRVKAADRTVCT